MLSIKSATVIRTRECKSGLFLEEVIENSDSYPPPPLRISLHKGQIEFLVPKDAQCFETYA